MSAKNFGVHSSYEYKIALKREKEIMYNLNYVLFQVFFMNWKNNFDVIFVYSWNYGFGINLYIDKQKIPNRIEQTIIVYSQGRLNV